jgi:Tol biopolymer transport system component
MKKFSIFLLFVLLLVSCQMPGKSETDLVLSYYCDAPPQKQDTCSRDLKTDQEESSISTQGYNFSGWYSAEKVLVNEYLDVNGQTSVEYYFFDINTKTLDCITCSLNNISYKILSPSLQKVAMYGDEELTLVDLSKPDETLAHASGFEATSQVNWSPDESFVVFIDGTTRLYRLDVNDQSASELLNKPSALQIFYPDISPAGDQVAFLLLDEDNSLSLAAMSVDGTDFRVLADLTPKTRKIWSSENTAISFAWSPTGDQIAFTANIEDQTSYLYKDALFVLKLSDTEPVLIDSSPTVKLALTWSPDGSLIAFMGQKEFMTDIWTISPDGTNLINQTNTPDRNEYGPSWKRAIVD